MVWKGPVKKRGSTWGGKKKRTTRGSKDMKLARLEPSATRAKVNNMIYNQLQKFSESKILPLTKYDESLPTPIQTLALAYWKGFVLGSAPPPAWSSTFNPLSGMACTQGDTSQDRNGNYVYLNRTHLTMEIDMSSAIETNVPHEFRVVMFKARRATDPASISKNPATSLFLSQIGSPEGHETPGINGTDLMCQPLNKRDWVIFHDKRFMMSPPSTFPATGDTSTGYTGKYPVFKRIVFNMPHKIKARYPPGTNPSEPINYDYRYGICVFARAIGKDQNARNWEVNIRGSTSFMG